jgi:hypothetical protein
MNLVEPNLYDFRMSVRLRFGPFSISSRGRVGVRVGPVSVSGGGRRRRRNTSYAKRSSKVVFEHEMVDEKNWNREQRTMRRKAAKDAQTQAASFKLKKTWRRRTEGAPIAIDPSLLASSTNSHHRDEVKDDTTVRPQGSSEITAQADLIVRIRLVMAEARIRKSKPPHVLLTGPTDAGRMMLAKIIAHELGARLRTETGAAMRRPGDLVALLTDLQNGEILFIDEVQQLHSAVEDILVEALTKGTLSVDVGLGKDKSSLTLQLSNFVFVGATIEQELLSHSLRDCFDFHAEIT